MTYHDITTPLPYADGSASLVMMSHIWSLLPVDARQPVLREVWRVLRPGGALRIDDNPERVYIDIIDNEFPRPIARDQLIGWCLELGFSPVHQVNPETTSIDAPEPIRAALIGNKLWHASFTLEAFKP